MHAATLAVNAQTTIYGGPVVIGLLDMDFIVDKPYFSRRFFKKTEWLRK
jgi:hypothetical protein